MTVQVRDISSSPSERGQRPARAPRAGGRFREQIALSSALDQKLAELQREGQLGFVLPTGEWAGVFAAAAAATEPTDWIFPSLREARVALFRGLPLAEVFRQALGVDGAEADPATSQAGHALPGALSDVAHRVASPGGTPGAHLPQAVGAAFAAKLAKRQEAALALAGIAATDTDDCHVALNFAGVFRAPVVFVFRGDAEWTGVSLAQRAVGYAIPAVRADGNDLAEVEAKVREALAAARAGQGPQLIEVTPPQQTKPGLIDSETLGAAARLCHAALVEASAGRRPGLASLVRGVYAEPPWSLDEQARDIAGETVVSPEDI